MSQKGAVECQECPMGSSPNETRNSCTCPDENIWIWRDERKLGGCVSPHPPKTSWYNSNGVLIAILATLAILVLIILLVGLFLIHEKRKRGKESLEPMNVIYNAECNDPPVHIIDGERRVREQVEPPIHIQVIVPEEAMFHNEAEDLQGSYENENIYADMFGE